ncbi:structural maintenance of chromosomes protein 5-like [Paramormyrops kingsleyae]|uniref:structural maintenance of chromosomes protein 5-like n=1 Tax=Paramormyrops kingsleyae TaxID=1676925 RepID=UPI003B96B73C
MLMSALYVALDAPFDYTISDMPYLRKWWCLLLMENFDLRSYGKLFAHWREDAKVVLQGQHVPIFRLKKRKLPEVSQEPAVVQDLHTAVQWVVQNKALFHEHVTMPKYLSLNKEDQQRVLREMLEEEDTEARDFFIFVFQCAEDMELFLQACVDEQGLRVNAMFEK